MIEVILPVLDEAQAIPGVLSAIPDGYVALVVDNGSTDGSANVARRLGARVVHEPRRGFGAACFAGLTAASADVVCFMDCDGSLDPRELPQVAEPGAARQTPTCASGRALRHPGAWPWHARAANRLLAFELRRRCRVPLTDLGPMRAAGREPLLALDLRDRGFGWPLEMVLRAAADGWNIAEVHGRAIDRAEGGRSKVSGSVRGTLRRRSRHGRAVGVSAGETSAPIALGGVAELAEHDRTPRTSWSPSSSAAGALARDRRRVGMDSRPRRLADATCSSFPPVSARHGCRARSTASARQAGPVTLNRGR